MKLVQFKPQHTNEVITLFKQVFSDSEGQDEGDIIGKLVTELIDTTSSSDLLGFVAIDADEIIACVFFSRLTFESDTNGFILSPLAVNTDNQGHGVGQKLINFSVEQLKNRDVEILLTYGDIRFYSKVGFIPISEEIIKAPLILSYPEGWLAQAINGNLIAAISGHVQCVDALNKQAYW